MRRGFVNVNDDLFWTRRIKREEFHQVQTFKQLEGIESRAKLTKAVQRARSAAAMLHRRVDKAVITDPVLRKG